MDNYDVAKKLIGVITPAGCSTTDEKRYESLIQTCDLIDKLIQDVKSIRLYSDSYEHSVKRSAVYADKFLKGLKEEL